MGGHGDKGSFNRADGLRVEGFLRLTAHGARLQQNAFPKHRIARGRGRRRFAVELKGKPQLKIHFRYLIKDRGLTVERLNGKGAKLTLGLDHTVGQSQQVVIDGAGQKLLRIVGHE